MLTFLESFLLGLLMVIGAVVFLLILERFWPRDVRREHNDIVGWQVTVVGTTYAVIIGFMLYAVWADFEVAKANVDAEANALVNISRLADDLPQAQKMQVQQIARQYAESMVTREWPAMSRGEVASDSQILTQKLWHAIMDPADEGGANPMVFQHTLTELTSLTEHRRLRQLEAAEGLPGILWAVLDVGAFITIASCCLFGTKSFPLHLLQVLALSILVALTLMAVVQIDRPFQGDVRVTPEAFIRAQQALE